MLKAMRLFSLYFFGIFSLVFFQSSIAGSPDLVTSRGIIYAPKYRAQENTLDAFVGIIQWNKDHPELKISGVEMHVVVVKPQNPGDAPIFVLSHDEDLFDLTGQKINIHDLSLQQIRSLQLKQILYNVDYGRTRNFSFLDQMLDAFMTDPPPFIIWLNVKDKDYCPTLGKMGYTSTELIKALKNWHDWYFKNRNVDIFKYIILISDNPFINYELNKLSIEAGLDKQGLNVSPNYWDMKLPLFMRKIFFAMGGFEKLLNMNSRWVSLQGALITPELVSKYHNQGKKILGWEIDNNNPCYKQMDAVLVSY